nr:hypothetical protein [Bacteroidota bacterium]
MKKRIRIYKNISDMHDQTYRIKFLFRKFTSHLFIPKTFLLIGFIPLMYLLAGCGKNDNTQLPPTIRLLNEPGSISSDTTVSLSALLTFTIAAEGTSTRVTNLIIEVTSDAISLTYLDTSMNTPGFTINKSFVKGLANKEIWTFII